MIHLSISNLPDELEGCRFHQLNGGSPQEGDIIQLVVGDYKISAKVIYSFYQYHFNDNSEIRNLSHQRVVSRCLSVDLLPQLSMETI